MLDVNLHYSSLILRKRKFQWLFCFVKYIHTTAFYINVYKFSVAFTWFVRLQYQFLKKSLT